MKQRLFNKKKYSQRCDSCFFGRLSADEEKVLCVREGIMMPDHRCKSYKYDPLKRRPEKAPKMQGFTPDEFKL